MDNITELLHQTFSVLVFCIAVFILFLEYGNYESVLIEAGSVLEEDIVFEQKYEKKANYISKGEILASLIIQPEYDVEIDGTVFHKTENMKRFIFSYNIPDTQYVKSYLYDEEGIITRVIYSSKDN